MYLTYKKGLKLNGQNPVLLYGYGGFGASTDPFYSFNNVIFCASGGILAVPLIRGGDDFGPAWHIAGVRLNKQNSFDDFIAAAEYLINNGYTNPNRLAIRGVSNGGLLVGAVLVQRPELFKVAVATAGIFDMTRFHLFTGGAFWQNEYGTPGNEQDFKNLLAYSPVHNVKNGVVYPAVLLVTGKNDDRVPPFNSFKFLAQLQEKSAGANPHIMYFEEESGHNGANSYEDYVRQRAFEMAFILKQLKADVRAAD
jgi:prolyl oligopeptidase